MTARPPASPLAPVPRAVRALRGAAGAAIATLLAAASHSLAGGQVTLFALVATTVLALPLCVALAGRPGSLWRLALGVGAAQFAYHWSFAGLGVTAPGAGASAAPLPLHAAHLAELQGFAPALASAGAADAAMWIAHAVSAAVSIALLHRGERAVMRLAGVLRRALPFRRFTPVLAAIPDRRAGRLALAAGETRRPREGLFTVSAVTRRGPPLGSFSA